MKGHRARGTWWTRLLLRFDNDVRRHLMHVFACGGCARSFAAPKVVKRLGPETCRAMCPRCGQVWVYDQKIGAALDWYPGWQPQFKAKPLERPARFREQKRTIPRRPPPPPVREPPKSPWPYVVLGCRPEDSLHEMKRRYRTLVVECHPDRLTARGASLAEISFGTRRMQALNAAWAVIRG